MTVKSIIDIDVNDASFKQFQKLFEKYEAALARHPDAWAKVATKINVGTKGFQQQVALAIARKAQIDLIAKAEEKANRLTASTADRWRDMARSTRTVAGNIGRATEQLLKWTALTTVFTGLIGGGGLFGIDRLAQSVSAGRRSATGLGTSFGAQRAFGLNFGRYVDSDRFLSGVSEAQRDVSKRVGFFGAGLSQGEMTGDTATVGAALLRHLKQIADQTPQGLMAQTLAARHLDQFVGLEDMTRLKGMSPAEMAQVQASFGRDRGTLDLPSATQKAWQDFAVQMSRAGGTIENVLVKGLTGLIGPLTRLSDGFTKAVQAFLGSDTIKKWLDEAGSGLDEFAKYVGTPKFRQDVGDFTKAIGDLASATVSALRWMGVIPDPNAPPATNWDRLGQENRAYNPYIGRLAPWARSKLNFFGLGNTPPTMDLIRRLENSGDAAVSPKGAIGRYQIMPGTAKDYMGKDFDTDRLKDPRVNEDVARLILKDLDYRYGGNIMEELVAYNAGPSVADKFKAAGDDSKMLPSETRKYLDRANVIIRIDNATGGSAVVSTNQVAQ
jgi:hypothetical protein